MFRPTIEQDVVQAFTELCQINEVPLVKAQMPLHRELSSLQLRNSEEEEGHLYWVDEICGNCMQVSTLLMYTKHDPRVTNTVIRYCIGAIDVVDLIFRYQFHVETFILSTSPRAEQI